MLAEQVCQSQTIMEAHQPIKQCKKKEATLFAAMMPVQIRPTGASHM
jgi:hypothetical protein